jgi:hypothetical protein
MLSTVDRLPSLLKRYSIRFEVSATLTGFYRQKDAAHAEECELLGR